MSDEMRTSWRDERSGIVHAVTVAGLQRARDGRLHAGGIVTDCGMDVPVVNWDGDGDVTCVMCLEGDWLARTSAELDAARPKTAAARSR